MAKVKISNVTKLEIKVTSVLFDLNRGFTMRLLLLYLVLPINISLSNNKTFNLLILNKLLDRYH